MCMWKHHRKEEKKKKGEYSSLSLCFSGKSPLWGTDFLPYTTLMYGNGPGHKIINGKRPDIRNVATSKTQSLFIEQLDSNYRI